jgi:enoyl-CoA hydratase
VVELELNDAVAVVTIDHPKTRNAISTAVMAGLETAIEAAAGAGVLVIRGAGDRAFVSGGDLKELSAVRTRDDASAMALRMREICDRLAGFPAPVIAALNGHALGGGAELAVAADIRVAAADITIGFNQANLAIMPAWGGAERLAALVGRGRALLLAGTGRQLAAAEAEHWGLVDVVLARDSFEEGWRSLARSLATAPAREIKQMIRAETSVDQAVHAFAELWVSDPHWEALDRLMNRRR